MATIERPETDIERPEGDTVVLTERAADKTRAARLGQIDLWIRWQLRREEPYLVRAAIGQVRGREQAARELGGGIAALRR